MPEPIGVAVIGYGYWSPKLIRNIHATPTLRLVAICEKSEQRHEQVRSENPGIEIVKEYKDVFSRPDIAAVVIATIPSSHFRIAKQALEAGKHVLVEKPMVLAKGEGEILIRLARAKERILMVDHTYLYSPAIRKMREVVSRGELGTLSTIESSRLNFGIFQRDVNVIWDLAPHDISILLYLLNGKPTYVSANASRPEVPSVHDDTQESDAHVTLQYENGLSAHIHVSWASPDKVRTFTIVGSGGVMLFDQLASPQLTLSKREGGESAIDIPQGGEDIAAMFADFAQSINSKKEPVSSARLGLDVVSILTAAQTSARSGGGKVAIRYAHPLPGATFLRTLYMRLRHGY